MAKFEFKLPDIGEGVVEGEIVKWLVKEGETIAEDQALVEVMTDKATVTIPSPKAGKVLQTFGNEGDIAKVHESLVLLEVEGAGGAEEAPAAAAEAPKAEAPPASPAMAAASSEGGKRVLATPVTRRIAREHGVDLATVAGSGPQGRVTKADVMALVEGGTQNVAVQQAVAPAAQQLPAAGGPSIASVEGDERIPVRGLRRKIAENLVRSKQTAPHYHFVEELDVTELVAFRQRMNAKLARSGEKLSFLPFLVKATIAALKKNPRCNANMDEQANELVLRGEFNIGIAVATDAGLVVPVLRHADRLSMREIASEIVRLSEAARAGKLSQNDIGGGTFTITSLGQTGGLFATPIINHPEVAIMGVHRMRKRPVVNDEGEIVVRDMMYLSWAFDHRNVDGAEGAKFAYDLIELVTDPEKLIAEMA